MIQRVCGCVGVWAEGGPRVQSTASQGDAHAKGPSTVDQEHPLRAGTVNGKLQVQFPRASLPPPGTAGPLTPRYDTFRGPLNVVESTCLPGSALSCVATSTCNGVVAVVGPWPVRPDGLRRATDCQSFTVHTRLVKRVGIWSSLAIRWNGAHRSCLPACQPGLLLFRRFLRKGRSPTAAHSFWFLTLNLI